MTIASYNGLYAQNVVYTDEALSVAWNFYTKTHKAAINGTTLATAATVPGIKWYSSKTREYMDFRKKYYLYLDSIQDKLLIYANVVGMGLEIQDLVRSFNMAAQEVRATPNIGENAFVTILLKEKRETLWDVIKLVQELNSMFIGIGEKKPREQRAKVKETDRIKLLEDARLKMRELSKKIRKLAFTIHSTNFYTLYYSLLNNYEFRKVDRSNVAKKCIEDWKLNGKIGISN